MLVYGLLAAPGGQAWRPCARCEYTPSRQKKKKTFVCDTCSVRSIGTYISMLTEACRATDDPSLDTATATAAKLFLCLCVVDFSLNYRRVDHGGHNWCSDAPPAFTAGLKGRQSCRLILVHLCMCSTCVVDCHELCVRDELKTAKCKLQRASTRKEIHLSIHPGSFPH